MQWSFTIGRIAGTATRIHITFLMFLLWIAVSDYRSGGFEAAQASVVFNLLIFSCVVSHGMKAAAIQIAEKKVWAHRS